MDIVLRRSRYTICLSVWFAFLIRMPKHVLNPDHLLVRLQLIALLTRHHRKKLPKFDDDSLKEFGEEAKQKLKVLCAIIRLSVVLHWNGCMNYREMDFSHSREGFMLIIREARVQNQLPGVEQCTADQFAVELRHESEYFKKVFKQELFVKLEAPPSCSD
ncbi:hypothetical protein V6N12_018091 [Hibiscus sabdariffa]|uniref:Uncharacterized protein n=1 Tax=Hibiscus sabdariffa TaxID=183260 RepID=A0ABR2AQ18_9ROSI